MALRLSIILVIFQATTWAQGQGIQWTPAEKAYLESHDTLWYGYTPDWAPIDYVNVRGEHTGVTRDVADIVEERTGLVLKAYPGLDWNASVISLAEGRTDLILVMKHSEERERLFLFTASYGESRNVIITRKDVDFIDDMRELDGRTIAMPKHYVVTQEVRSKLPHSPVILTSNMEESLLRVASGQAYATITNIIVGSYYIKRMGHSQLKISGPTDITPSEFNMAVNLKDTVLQSILNKVIEDIHQEDRIRVVEKWLPQEDDTPFLSSKLLRIMLWSALGLFLLVFVIGFWSFSLKREVNRRKRLESLLRETLMQIKEKNQELTDSIQYAKRIQDAILPSPKLVKERLPESFVLYMPRDIIAGDFYWMETLKKRVYFAAADCTGHGVPGAMVSVIGANSLNKALYEERKLSPGDILESTSSQMLDTLHTHESEVKDGMDIALCCLIPNEGSSDVPYDLEYAGANNSLYIVRKTDQPLSDTVNIEPKVPIKSEHIDGYTIHEIKGNKRPIGFYPDESPFVNHHLELLPGDSIYVFTDGYPDQFGGVNPEHPNGKKFKYGRLKELLCSIQHLNMSDQRQQLLRTLYEWKGDLDQVDDICIIGVQI